MQKIDEDIGLLCSNALRYGASKAAPIASKEVVLDPRVRLKCLVPLCSSYGVGLTCPPNVPDPEEVSIILDKYRHAILIQMPFSMNKEFVGLVEKGAPLADTRKDTNYQETLARNFRQLVEILCKLEADAQTMGYRFAAALSGGSCRLCDECVGQKSGEPCRHPFMARPAMEAVGIDVVQTAKNAGMPFEFPAKGDPTLTGILFVD